MTTDRIFRLALWIGAIADVLVGLTMIVLPRVFVDVGLGAPPPLVAWFVGVFAAGWGVAYGLAARDPARHQPFVALAAALRFASVITFATAVARDYAPAGLLLLAAGEGVLGAIHALHARALAAEGTRAH